MGSRLLDDLFRDLDRLHRMGASPSEMLLEPAVWSIATYRVGRALRTLPRPIGLPLRVLHRPWEILITAFTGVTLPTGAEIGGGLYLGHTGGIVVSPYARLGRDVNLSHGTTIGVGGRDEKSRGVPFIGDRVYIGPGARLFGPIRVGNDAAIGANAVVNRDVPDQAVMGGVPARVLSSKGSHTLVMPGRPRPPMEDLVRRFVRSLLPRPTQLFLRP